MSSLEKVKFGSLRNGDVFSCYGDEYLNYNYPKVCDCKKIDEETAKEIGPDGINFLMNKHDEVFIVI
jgi:hypothetical protein